MASAPKEWHYSKDGNQFGPVTGAALKQLAANGDLSQEDLVWKEGMTSWKPASSVKGLFPTPSPPKPPPISRRKNTTNEAECPIFDTEKKSGVKDYLIAASLVLCFPVGLLLMWTKTKWQTQTKWIVTSVVCVFLIVASVSRTDKEKSRNFADLPSDEQKNLGANPTITDYDVGTEFKLGDYKYCINRVWAQPSIGNQYLSERASPGATFVIVSYTIENCTNESTTVLSDDFSILDSQGRTFKPSSKASAALTIHENKDLILSELQPGLPAPMQQAFEVPQQITKSELTIVVPKKGLWSSGDAKVKVRVN